MTESDLQAALFSVLFDRGYTYVTPNVHLYAWESDVLGVTDSGYVTEYEIKLTRSDFKRDQTKSRHHVLRAAASGEASMNSKVPARFFYATPPGLVAPKDLPPYAGLVFVRPGSIDGQAQPPRLTTAKARGHQKERLSRSLMWQAWKKPSIKNR